MAYATSVYFTWSGRFLTEVVNGLIFSRPDLFGVLALLPPLAFAALPLALVASLHSFDGGYSAASRWVVAAGLLAALYVGLLPYLGDCVFWLTGGVGYVVPVLASVVWLGLLTRIAPAQPSVAIVCVALAVPLGLASEQTSAALIVAAAVGALMRRSISPAYAVAGCLLIVGSVFLVMAPGNAARAALGQRGLATAVVDLFANYAWLAANTWNRLVPAVLAGSILGLAFALWFGTTHVNRHGLRTWSVVMFAAAFGATLPLAAVPDFAAPRTAFVPGVFLLAGCAGAGSVLGGLPAVSSPRMRLLGAGLATCLVACYLGLAGEDWSLARHMRPELAARWQILQLASGSGADVTVSPFTARQPMVVYVPDLSADPAWWTNVGVANFFGLRSVRISQR